MRNPNRYGTCYKLSGKRRNPYIARAFLRWDDNGRAVYQTLGYYPTRKEGMLALAAYQSGTAVDAPILTLRDVYDEWSRIHYENISYSTKCQYLAAWNRLKVLEKSVFSNLRHAHLQSVIDDARTDVKKGSLEKIKLLANQLYEYAIKNDICNKNYATFIELPREEKAQKSIFTDLEKQKLWDNIDMPYADSVLVMIFTGLRVGELLQLTRFNIDFKENIVRGGLKTDAGKNRVIPISSKIANILQKWCSQNKSGKLINLTYWQYSKRFNAVMSELNIKNKTPHCCRHTFATDMAKNGADVNALKKIMGHANYSTTADIYTHLNVESLREAISKL